MKIKNILIEEIIASPMNPRKKFDAKGITELAENISQQGLLQPITIRPVECSGFAATFPPSKKYEIVCGERRFRAILTLELLHPGTWKTIPAIIRELNDAEAFDAMITENLQRKDVDPMEEAFSFAQLVEKGGKVEEVALRFGKSTRFVQDRIRLNALIPELADRVREGTMALGAAMLICKVSKERQEKFFSDYKAMETISKMQAEGFITRDFTRIEYSSWHATDKDFKGSCGCACSDCQFNTANDGCLFWDMKTEDGRCTNKARFEQKHVDYLMERLEREDLVKKGEPLAKGKTVIIDNGPNWCSNKAMHKQVMSLIEERGYEVVPNSTFSISYLARTAESKAKVDELLEAGEIYRVIEPMSYSSLPKPQVNYYNVKQSDKTEGGDIAPAEVRKLVDELKDNERVIREQYCKQCTQLVEDNLPMKIHGELAEDERKAFLLLILRLLSKEFFIERYNLDLSPASRGASVEQILEIIETHPEDEPLWIREYIARTIDITYLPGSTNQRVSEMVLPLWDGKRYENLTRKLTAKYHKTESDIKSRLEELGYDTDGNKL